MKHPLEIVHVSKPCADIRRRGTHVPMIETRRLSHGEGVLLSNYIVFTSGSLHGCLIHLSTVTGSWFLNVLFQNSCFRLRFLLGAPTSSSIGLGFVKPKPERRSHDFRPWERAAKITSVIVNHILGKRHSIWFLCSSYLMARYKKQGLKKIS